MRDKYVKNNNEIPLFEKEFVNHIKYIGAGLKWCIGDDRNFSLG